MSSYRIALAGNPNTGKSTLFNLLTGLKQHTGNWTGKTVLRAEGEFSYQDKQFQIIDLPGTYSLYSNSADEEVARDYIIFEQPDITIVVLDATALERNLNLALQVLEMTDKVVIGINLIDEAEKLGIKIDDKSLAQKLGVPVVKISAREEIGVNQLLDTVIAVITGKLHPTPLQIKYSEQIEAKIDKLIPYIITLFGNRYPARWLALRFLDGDASLIASLKDQLFRMNQQEMKTYGQSFGLNT